MLKKRFCQHAINEDKKHQSFELNQATKWGGDGDTLFELAIEICAVTKIFKQIGLK